MKHAKKPNACEHRVQGRLDDGLQHRAEDEKPPQPVCDTRYGGEKLDQKRSRRNHPSRGNANKEKRRSETEGNCKKQRERRTYRRAEYERRRPEHGRDRFGKRIAIRVAHDLSSRRAFGMNQLVGPPCGCGEKFHSKSLETWHCR